MILPTRLGFFISVGPHSAPSDPIDYVDGSSASLMGYHIESQALITH
jgi:hypothetical protein